MPDDREELLRTVTWQLAQLKGREPQRGDRAALERAITELATLVGHPSGPPPASGVNRKSSNPLLNAARPPRATRIPRHDHVFVKNSNGESRCDICGVPPVESTQRTPFLRPFP